MTETPGARAWLGEGADAGPGQHGDNKDQKSPACHVILHSSHGDGAALDAGQGWKVLFVPPFIGFVTIRLCVLLWDGSQENPKLVQPGAATELQTVRFNRHLQATESSHSILSKPQS